jgi:hypothetical protein
LAGYQYKAGQTTGQRILGDAPTRDLFAEVPSVRNHVQEGTAAAKSARRATLFDNVRSEIDRRADWHGYDSMEKAFVAAGESDLYARLFRALSEYVHGESPDRDLANIVEDRATVAPFTSSDTLELGRIMAEAAFRTLNVLMTLITGRPVKEVLSDTSADSWPDGVAHLAALGANLVVAFDEVAPPEIRERAWRTEPSHGDGETVATER